MCGRSVLGKDGSAALGLWQGTPPLERPQHTAVPWRLGPFLRLAARFTRRPRSSRFWGLTVSSSSASSWPTPWSSWLEHMVERCLRRHVTDIDDRQPGRPYPSRTAGPVQHALAPDTHGFCPRQRTNCYEKTTITNSWRAGKLRKV